LLQSKSGQFVEALCVVRFIAGRKNSVSLLVPVNGNLTTVQTNTFSEARLGQHLFHALCASDSVEVPGWGVFTVRPYGADIQLVSGLFLPPARRVSFSPNEAVRGESFLRQVASVEGCDAAEATRLVHNVVRGWRVRLDRGERIFLESIGAFSLRNTFQWVFQPALEANFLPESYGLPIYRLPVLVPANEVPVRSLRATVSPVRSSAPEPATPSAAARTAPASARIPSADHSEERAAPPVRPLSDRRIRSNREKWLAPIRSAAVFTGIVGLLVVGGTKPGFQQDVQNVLHEASWMRLPKLAWPSMDLFSQPPLEEPVSPQKEVEAPAAATKTAEPAPAVETPAPPVSQPQAEASRDEEPANEPARVDAAWAKPAQADAPAASVSKEVKSTTSATSAKKTSTSSKGVTATQESKDHYYLVVGAFGDRANAERLVSTLRAQGQNAQIVPSSLGTTKVAAGSARTEEEAQAQREVLKKSFPAVWVFRGNPQP
jgi:cell division septation protein DedD